ncbi:tRNA dimethylallyltransferase [Striga asiatica]|uniref:tRNA dimethylallyltransferase n=1 Tax=Striga asiatica TaxID=4170 RepID=A0A5A7PHT1_STRAF|nr:tRNA dimethylallyltransferase [Striga asiatica]
MADKPTKHKIKSKKHKHQHPDDPASAYSTADISFKPSSDVKPQSGCGGFRVRIGGAEGGRESAVADRDVARRGELEADSGDGELRDGAVQVTEEEVRIVVYAVRSSARHLHKRIHPSSPSCLIRPTYTVVFAKQQMADSKFKSSFNKPSFSTSKLTNKGNEWRSRCSPASFKDIMKDVNFI